MNERHDLYMVLIRMVDKLSGSELIQLIDSCRSMNQCISESSLDLLCNSIIKKIQNHK